jgi:hypothetical protein
MTDYVDYILETPETMTPDFPITIDAMSVMIEGKEYHHGNSVTCFIHSTPITDAKIYIGKKLPGDAEEIIESELREADIYNFGAYICQNDISGSEGPDLLGYNKSWVFGICPKTGQPNEGVIKLRRLKYYCKDELEKIVQLAFPTI